jgi:hypothetical protein
MKGLQDAASMLDLQPLATALQGYPQAASCDEHLAFGKFPQQVPDQGAPSSGHERTEQRKAKRLEVRNVTRHLRQSVNLGRRRDHRALVHGIRQPVHQACPHPKVLASIGSTFTSLLLASACEQTRERGWQAPCVPCPQAGAA